jgi:serpin B
MSDDAPPAFVAAENGPYARPTSVVARRAVLRLAVLTAIASSLAACGDGGGARDPGDVELVKSDLARSTGRPDAIPQVVDALHGLAGGLYGQLATKQGNMVLSPYSVAVALGMTLPGAAGRTASEIRHVLGVRDDALFHSGLNALTAYLEGLAGTQHRTDGTGAELALEGANQLYGQEGVAWERDFLDLLAREYGAGVRTVDYQDAPETARAVINAWVADRTHDRIPELIPAGVLNTLTRLVLVNALYLKAPWEHPFEKSSTSSSAFHRSDGSTINVDTMQEPLLATTMTRGKGWRAAQLPYAGRSVAMTLVLPDPGRLRQVEQQVTSGGLAEVLAVGRDVILDVRLPRWTFRSQSALNDALQQLGMRTAFDPEAADFRRMTEEDLDLYISAVLHEGFVAVDEDGTEAAAATAVVISTTSAPVTEPFHVDRPFLFVIHDLKHGTPLFLGRVDDPSE